METNTTKKYLSIKEFAEHFNRSYSSIYHLVRTNRIQSIRVGFQYRIPVDVLNQFEDGGNK
jgi:excisionase family DNA binding protein